MSIEERMLALEDALARLVLSASKSETQPGEVMVKSPTAFAGDSGHDADA